MIKPIILVVLIAFSGCAKKIELKQNKEDLIAMEIKKVKSLGKKGIIEMANKRLTRYFMDTGIKGFEPDGYDEIKVLTSSKSIIVDYIFWHRFIPIGGCYYYDIHIDLIQDIIGCGPTVHPKGCISTQRMFFKHNKESKKALKFIYDTLYKGAPAGKIEPFVVFEFDNYYRFESYGENTSGGCKIEKDSGKIFDEWHRHLAPRSKDPKAEKFREMK